MNKQPNSPQTVVTQPSVKPWDCGGQLPGGNECNYDWPAGQCFKNGMHTQQNPPEGHAGDKKLLIYLKGVHSTAVWRSPKAHWLENALRLLDHFPVPLSGGYKKKNSMCHQSHPVFVEQH